MQSGDIEALAADLLADGFKPEGEMNRAGEYRMEVFWKHNGLAAVVWIDGVKEGMSIVFPAHEIEFNTCLVIPDYCGDVNPDDPCDGS